MFSSLAGFITSALGVFSLDMWMGAVLGAIASALFAIVLEGLNRLRTLWPVSRLLEDLRIQGKGCAVFIRQMHSADPNNPNLYLAKLPDPFPPHWKDQTSRHPNIPHVVAKSDMQAATDVINVLGQAGKTKNINFLSIVEHYAVWDQSIICVGGSYKTTQVFYNDGHETVWIAPGKIVPEAPAFYFPDRKDEPFEGIGIDYGLIFKTYYKPTGTICLVIMGLGVNGTEAAGYYFRNHTKDLGKIFGRNRFALLVKAHIKDGPQSAKPCWYYPEPKATNKALFPRTWSRMLSKVKKIYP